MIHVGSIIPGYAHYVTMWIYEGAYVNGIWSIDMDSPKSIQILASIQETAGKDLEFLPEGSRLEEFKTIYSQQVLPIDDYQYSLGQMDIRFVINNITYRLVKNLKWYQDYSKFIVQQLRANDAVPT